MVTLSEVLVIQGTLTPERAEILFSDAGADQIRRAKELVAQGTLSEVDYAQARAQLSGLPFVRLEQETIDPITVKRLPSSAARMANIVPLSIDSSGRQERVRLAMAEPDDILAIDDVRVIFGLPVSVVVAPLSDVRRVIDAYNRVDDEMSELSTTLESLDEGVAQAKDSTFQVNERDGDGGPIVRFVNLMLSQAIRDRASDIHVEPTEDRVRIRYRIDGVLHEMPAAPKAIQSGIISRLKIMADVDIAERRVPQDGRISVQQEGQKIDLRVATLPTVWGEKIVLRILDQTRRSLSAANLGMSESNLETFREAYNKPHGMTLVTGPTGSGKSTTLYTAVSELAVPGVNVITIEDPVEYRVQNVNQVQVNVQAGLTFSTALRSILRSDPDIMLIGEIRDTDTAHIAIESALTGHLVLSTLHTNDAPSAVSRLSEMGVEPFLVASALDLVVAQRLVRQLCTECKQVDTDEAITLQALGFTRTPGDDRPIYKPVGCKRCSGTGYLGRLAVHEVMKVTEEIGHLAIARASSSEIARKAKSQGMRTLREDGWEKTLEGRTSVEELLRVIA